MHADTADQPIPADGAEATVAAAGGLVWQLLDFTMQPQDQTNWCWAAVAASADAFFNAVSAQSQCAIANGELGRTDCCGGGAAGPCNVYGLLASALTRVGQLWLWGYKKTATLPQIHSEIDGSYPVCFRTASAGGGAHFIAVVGYLPGSETISGSEFVAVEDPWWGSSDLPYDQLLMDYRTGVCTDTFYTKR
jgi:hypothetical protein